MSGAGRHFCLLLQRTGAFSALAALNQLSKKRPALVDRVVQRLKGGREEDGDGEAGDVPYKVSPKLEGRIVRIVDQEQPDA